MLPRFVAVPIRYRDIARLWELSVLFSLKPKARGLAQHGGPPDLLEESDPTGVILNVMDGLYRLPFPYRIGCPDMSCTAAS